MSTVSAMSDGSVAMLAEGKVFVGEIVCKLKAKVGNQFLDCIALVV